MSENIVPIKSSQLFSMVSEILQSGKKARITVTGSSMYPFLREGIDSVNLSKPDYSKVKRGTIVLIMRSDGVYVLHRVLRKNKDCFYMIGDAQQWIEGPLLPSQIVAVVESIWRENYEIKCDNILWKISSHLWLVLIPIRHKIFGLIRRIRNIKP